MRTFVSQYRQELRLKRPKTYRLVETSLDKSFEDIITIAAKLFDVPKAAIVMFDENKLWIKSQFGHLLPESVKKYINLTPSLQSSAFVLEDTRENENFTDRYAEDKCPLRFYAVAPILSDAGVQIGNLCMFDTKPKIVTPEYRALLLQTARMVTNLADLKQKEYELHELTELHLRERNDLNKISKVQNQMIEIIAGATARLETAKDPSFTVASSVSMLRNLQVWAKTELQESTLNISKVSITQLLRSIISNCQKDAELKLNQVHFEPSQSHIIETDEALLKFVLSSLLDHANNTTCNGEIRLQAIEDADHLVIVISDESRGKSNLRNIDYVRWENKGYIFQDESAENINYFFCWQLINKLGGWMQLKAGKKGNFVSITLKKIHTANRAGHSVHE